MFRFVPLRYIGVSIFEMLECANDGSKAPGRLHIETYRVGILSFSCQKKYRFYQLSQGSGSDDEKPGISMEIGVLGLYLCECDDGQTPAEIKVAQGGT